MLQDLVHTYKLSERMKSLKNWLHVVHIGYSWWAFILQQNKTKLMSHASDMRAFSSWSNVLGKLINCYDQIPLSPLVSETVRANTKKAKAKIKDNWQQAPELRQTEKQSECVDRRRETVPVRQTPPGPRGGVPRGHALRPASIPEQFPGQAYGILGKGGCHITGAPWTLTTSCGDRVSNGLWVLQVNFKCTPNAFTRKLAKMSKPKLHSILNSKDRCLCFNLLLVSYSEPSKYVYMCMNI